MEEVLRRYALNVPNAFDAERGKFRFRRANSSSTVDGSGTALTLAPLTPPPSESDGVPNSPSRG